MVHDVLRNILATVQNKLEAIAIADEQLLPRTGFSDLLTFDIYRVAQ